MNPADPLRKFSRGDRRNAARALRKQLAAEGRKHSFREVWEQGFRRKVAKPQAGILGGLMQTVAKLVVRHIVTPCGRTVHPTKGWRGNDGLPLGRKVWA